MADSSNPLQIGEDLFVTCEIGLDQEILDYINESHSIQIKVGAEPFYLWHREDAGALISKSVTSWSTTTPQYSAYIWQPGDGESNHPNARIQQNKFKVFDNSVEMTRVYDPDSIYYDTEYALEIETGVNTSDMGAVRIWFNESFVPTNISYAYKNICSCVDTSTGYPNRECSICRGTSYPAAFIQYTCDSSKYNPANTVLVRVPMVAEIKSPEQIGRVIRRDSKFWMENSPDVNNFDVIMGTTGRNAGLLFEIVTKSDSRIRGQLMHQEFQVILIEKTDVRYDLAPITVAQTTEDWTTITSNATVI